MQTKPSPPIRLWVLGLLVLGALVTQQGPPTSVLCLLEPKSAGELTVGEQSSVAAATEGGDSRSSSDEDELADGQSRAATPSSEMQSEEKASKTSETKVVKKEVVVTTTKRPTKKGNAHPKSKAPSGGKKKDTSETEEETEKEEEVEAGDEPDKNHIVTISEIERDERRLWLKIAATRQGRIQNRNAWDSVTGFIKEDMPRVPLPFQPMTDAIKTGAGKVYDYLCPQSKWPNCFTNDSPQWPQATVAPYPDSLGKEWPKDPKTGVWPGWAEQPRPKSCRQIPCPNPNG